MVVAGTRKDVTLNRHSQPRQIDAPGPDAAVSFTPVAFVRQLEQDLPDIRIVEEEAEGEDGTPGHRKPPPGVDTQDAPLAHCQLPVVPKQAEATKMNASNVSPSRRIQVLPSK